MTGISSPYEAPIHPDIEIKEHYTINESTALIYKLIKEKLPLNNV